jgi:hypothetical protein
MRTFKTLLIALFLLATASSAMAQGCAMCYASSAQEDARAQQALNLGIIVLIIPPVLLFAGVMVTAFRRRDEGDDQDPSTCEETLN